MICPSQSNSSPLEKKKENKKKKKKKEKCGSLPPADTVRAGGKELVHECMTRWVTPNHSGGQNVDQIKEGDGT